MRSDGQNDLEHLARTQATLCLYLSIDKLEEVTPVLAAHYGRECPAAVVYRASWPDQKIVRGPLGQIGAMVRDQGIERTGLLLVGRALDRPVPSASRLYDKTFRHGYRNQ